MKKALLAGAALLLFTYSWSQDFAVLDAVTFDKPEDYQAAEESVIECTTYLLSTPLLKNNPNRISAARFVTLWMTSTPDYSFALDATATDISEKNESLLGVYMAAMARHVLKNKESASNAKEVKLQTVRRTLEYCTEPLNRVKMGKKLKAMVAAENAGTLEAYLGM